MKPAQPFKVHDHIETKNPDTNETVLGKINTIAGEVVQFNIYKLPEQFPCGRLPHHSRLELFRTDETAKEFLQNIVRKIDVIKFSEYIEKYPGGKDAPADGSIYIFRQRFRRESNEFLPELKQICYCKKYLNPDDPVMMCPNCKLFLHPKCLIQTSARQCSACHEPVDLP